MFAGRVAGAKFNGLEKVETIAISVSLDVGLSKKLIVG